MSQARGDGVERQGGKGLVFVVAAPSGAGKTSLVNAVLARDEKLAVCISHTTRPRRPAERDGVNYHFVSEAVFSRMIEADAFLEHAEVFGHRYGTSLQSLAEARAGGRDLILEIDWQGAAQIRSKLVESIGIFILPPSLAALEDRLRQRGQDSPETIAGRLREAQQEMAQCEHFNYRIVNDRFECAVADIEAVVRAERLKS